MLYALIIVEVDSVRSLGIWRARLFLHDLLASLFRWRFCLLQSWQILFVNSLACPLHTKVFGWSIYALFGITSIVHLVVPILLYRSLKSPTCSRQQYHRVLFVRKRAWLSESMEGLRIYRGQTYGSPLSMQPLTNTWDEKPSIYLDGDRYCKDLDNFEKSNDRNASISIVNNGVSNRIHGKGGRRI